MIENALRDLLTSTSVARAAIAARESTRALP